MNMQLPAEIKSIQVDEMESAMQKIIDDTIEGGQNTYDARIPEIARRFPGFVPLLEFETDEENQALGWGKIQGYRFSICLIATVAENRRSARLKKALVSITADEMMDAFCEIFEGDTGDLVNDFVKKAEEYRGFCQGSSKAFSYLSEDGRLDQMAMGHVIFCATLLKIAEAREDAN
jgi:hypothetical protein